jgi:hypothetical protein
MSTTRTASTTNSTSTTDSASAATTRDIQATVVYARPDRQWVLPVQVLDGSTIGEAVAQSGLLALCPELAGAALEMGVFHRRRAAHSALREGDRIEIYRALQIDAKQARRLRAAGKTAAKKKTGGANS